MTANCGDNLKLLFNEIKKWQKLPANFDDSFLDKLIDCLPTDEKTVEIVTQFLIGNDDSTNTLTLHLSLRLLTKFIPFYDRRESFMQSDGAAEHILDMARSVMHREALLRESLFNLAGLLIEVTNGNFHSIQDDMIEDAVTALKSKDESVFVQRAAQTFIVRYLRSENQNTSNSAHSVCSSLCNSLLSDDTTAPNVINALSAVLDQFPQTDLWRNERCKPLLDKAKSTPQADQSFWSLVAFAITNNAESSSRAVEMIGSPQQWASNRARFSVIKNSICRKNGFTDDVFVDLLLDDLTMAHLVDSLPFIPSLELRSKYVNHIIGKLTKSDKVSSQLIDGLLTASSSSDTDTIQTEYSEPMNQLLVDLVKRKALDRPRLIEKLLENGAISFDNLRAELESVWEMAKISLADQNWEIRDSAVELLLVLNEIFIKYGHEELIDESVEMKSKLLDMSRNDPSHFVQASTFRLLATFPSKFYLDTASDAVLNDPDPIVRRAAISIFTSISSSSSFPSDFCSTEKSTTSENLLLNVISKMHSETDAEVKREAIKICANSVRMGISVDKYLDIIEQEFLADDNPDTAFFAFEALNETDLGKFRVGQLSVSERDLRRKRAFAHNAYALNPSSLVGDILCALKKASNDDHKELLDQDENNLKDCY